MRAKKSVFGKKLPLDGYLISVLVAHHNFSDSSSA